MNRPESVDRKAALRSQRKSEKIVAGCLLLIRNLIYASLYLLARMTSRQEISVLAYHSIGSNGSFYAVSPEQFRRQMDYLRKNYRIVSLNEIMNFVEAKNRLPRKSVALTFDDGYHDNYSNVYPYLRKHGLPATIFVTVGYVQSRTAPLGEVFLKTLSLREIKEMNENEIEIGAHSMSHPDLATMDCEEGRKEIANSKAEIEDVIGRSIRYFAYPFSSYDNRVIELVRSSGFRGAFGGSGLTDPGDNPFCLKRVSVDSSVGFPIFKARLTRAVDWYNGFEQHMKIILSRFLFAPLIVRAYNDAGKGFPT